VSEPHEFNEPFSARWYAIVNIEGQDDAFEDGIVAVFIDKGSATADLWRRQSLPADDDDHVDEYHAVLPIHVDAIGWNSHDPPPDGWPNKEAT
jgi:hypothetical protein